jgi:urease accessory protein
MQSSTKKNLWRLTALVTLFLVALPACAHPDANHGVSGFAAGFLHPLTGLDHLLAMLAVGIWAAQSQGEARWPLVLSFPLLGALISALGVPLAGVELTIGLSLAVLGLLIAFAVSLPTALSTGLIAFFAVFHGYAHAAELRAGVSMWAYGTGFIVATTALHFIGLSFGLLRKIRFEFMVRRFSGIGIAVAGVALLLGLFWNPQF